MGKSWKRSLNPEREGREPLHEYSYNAGFLRKEFGIESHRYGGPAFSAFHRYALNDSFTAGLRTEGTHGFLNLGPQFMWGLKGLGIMNLALSGSMGRGSREGVTGLLSHSFQGRQIGTRLFIKSYTRHYTTIAPSPAAEPPRLEWGAGIGYGTRAFGALFLDFNNWHKYEGPDRRVGSLVYSRNVTLSSTISFSYRDIKVAGQRSGGMEPKGLPR